MNDEERERLYREAMAARRAGDVCPLCGSHHSALSACERPEDRKPAEPLVPSRVPPSARNTDPETSHEAATPSKEALRFTCLGFYADHPEGLVDDDLARLAGHAGGHESYRRRGSDLRALGWTEWAYEFADEFGGDTRPLRRRTHLGASARVSVITYRGRSVLDEREGVTS